ncbi:tryptophan--tRNA ligase [bacterium]|nr:MAG: tryptophan--tRNA ligase [bacterium]
MNKSIIFSGIQPSGNLTIGQYFGAIRQWVEMQNIGQNYFCIVDLHAITVPQDPVLLKERTRQVAVMFLACGIDPEKSVLFVQSQNHDHAQLAWILNCFTPLGWLNKMTQFKEKGEKQKEIISAGLLDYPVLMASDILLYNTTDVPVGEDQIQHVELARDIAKAVNAKYDKEVFVLPKAKVGETGARIMNLQDPTRKMSKSEKSDLGIIYMLDDEETIKNKIKKAVTDSGSEIKSGADRPALSNLLTIFSLTSGKTVENLEADYAGKNYSDFKSDLAESIIEFLKPIQEKYKKIIADKNYLDKVLKDGLEKAKMASGKKLGEVERVVGLGL